MPRLLSEKERANNNFIDVFKRAGRLLRFGGSYLPAGRGGVGNRPASKILTIADVVTYEGSGQRPKFKLSATSRRERSTVRRPHLNGTTPSRWCRFAPS